MEPACKPFEQRKCCACNGELFDICVNCHNKAGVLERSHAKFVCLVETWRTGRGPTASVDIKASFQGNRNDTILV